MEASKEQRRYVLQPFYSTEPQNLLLEVDRDVPSQGSEMCILEETYHVACGHWGSRTNSHPCSRAIGRVGLTKGCWDSMPEGVVRVNTKCIACTRVQDGTSTNPGWSPFEDISTGAWREINGRRRRRPAPQARYPRPSPNQIRGAPRSGSSFHIRVLPTDYHRPCLYFLGEPLVSWSVEASESSWRDLPFPVTNFHRHHSLLGQTFGCLVRDGPRCWPKWGNALLLPVI